MNDKIAQSLGFADAREFFQMVANADISTPEKIEAFRRWQDESGNKSGLETLQKSNTDCKN